MEFSKQREKLEKDFLIVERVDFQYKKVLHDFTLLKEQYLTNMMNEERLRTAKILE